MTNEDKYDELLMCSRKVLRYYGVDMKRFTDALEELDTCIQRQLIEAQHDE